MLKVAKHFGYIYWDIKRALENGDTNAIRHMIGGRWSGKTFNLMVSLIYVLFINHFEEFKDKKIVINWNRYSVGGAKENFSEFKDNLKDMGVFDKVYINNSERYVIYRNITIRFIGLVSNRDETVKKLGLKRFSQVDLMINVFEEIFQFGANMDILKMEQTFGSSQGRITFNLTNGWDESHWYLSYLIDKIRDKKLIYNKDKMMEIGYQNYQLEVDERLDWSNHRVNEFLTDSDRAKFKELWNIDPVEAAIVDRGDMGVVSGGIYNRVINKVLPIPQNFKVYKYRVGIDYGKSRGATAGVILGFTTGMKQYAVFNEYYHNHSTNSYMVDGLTRGFRKMDILDYGRDIVDWLEGKFTTILPYKIEILVDYASSLDQVLEAVINSRGLADKYIVKPAVKVPVSLRIDMTLVKMTFGHMYWDPYRVKMLKREMKESRYEDDSEKKLALKKKAYDMIRLDGKDHLINSLEYAISEIYLEWRNDKSVNLLARGR